MSPVLAATSPSALWYLTRGSGLVLLAVLTVALALGIVNRSGWSPPGWPRFVMAGLHRNLALLGVALLAIHIVTAELDPFAPVGWLAVVVPFLFPYRPLWLGLGTLSLDVLVAVIATSLLRSHLSLGVWRVVHWLAYLAWPVALLHALGTGTDTRRGAGMILVLPGSACGIKETARVVDWLAAESAGQCGPCVRGLAAVAGCLVQLASPGSARAVDLGRLARWCGDIEGRGACRHPDGVVNLVRSCLEAFASEVKAHRGGSCASYSEGWLPLPRVGTRRP